MCSLSNLRSISLISKVCFHIVMVANSAPGLMEPVAGRLSFKINTVMAGFLPVLIVVSHASPLSKTEREQTWMTHWHYSSRFLLYL